MPDPDIAVGISPLSTTLVVVTAEVDPVADKVIAVGVVFTGEVG